MLLNSRQRKLMQPRREETPLFPAGGFMQGWLRCEESWALQNKETAAPDETGTIFLGGGWGVGGVDAGWQLSRTHPHTRMSHATSSPAGLVNGALCGTLPKTNKRRVWRTITGVPRWCGRGRLLHGAAKAPACAAAFYLRPDLLVSLPAMCSRPQQHSERCDYEPFQETFENVCCSRTEWRSHLLWEIVRGFQRRADLSSAGCCSRACFISWLFPAPLSSYSCGAFYIFYWLLLSRLAVQWPPLHRCRGGFLIICMNYLKPLSAAEFN